MATKRESIDLYVDESGITLPSGRHLLIYAAVDPYDLAKALTAIAETKAVHGLPPETELKWNSDGGDGFKKAKAKEAFLWSIANSTGAIISCTEGPDKDEAFLNLLEDVKSLLLERGPKRVRIIHDDDAFRSRSRIEATVDAWPSELVCESITAARSSTTPGIQFADLTAGTFRYRVSCRFGVEPKKVLVADEENGTEEEWPLDDFFAIMFRWSVWGGERVGKWDGKTDPAGFWTEELYTFDCFGAGIRFHGDFSEEEVASFRQVCFFYRGCMH